ncbi:hypothetical protein NDU88_000634 [Pleurodeles waltl]|uniref:Uncharacterized protein n=1 Tax=Pleurodeles waltl TaxID=8319 RepID=A0AAV7Q1T3_PLEWA|nr:hypothetical protein NDU88_000634 [Pleurodeles waltl]
MSRGYHSRRDAPGSTGRLWSPLSHAHKDAVRIASAGCSERRASWVPLWRDALVRGWMPRVPLRQAKMLQARICSGDHSAGTLRQALWQGSYDYLRFAPGQKERLRFPAAKLQIQGILNASAVPGKVLPSSSPSSGVPFSSQGVCNSL